MTGVQTCALPILHKIYPGQKLNVPAPDPNVDTYENGVGLGGTAGRIRRTNPIIAATEITTTRVTYETVPRSQVPNPLPAGVRILPPGD